MLCWISMGILNPVRLADNIFTLVFKSKLHQTFEKITNSEIEKMLKVVQLL